ncbi:MAG: phosphoadenosine phosphosulfate reductase family protein [Pyrinomonadaceae bacterium]|nr:phosphoadenosine phosphosulfate reductase family protein [Pyrinomonadaceae bacterium]
MSNQVSKKVRHILSVSGGKDSSALAIYMSNRQYWRERLGKIANTPIQNVDMEYVFCDTKEELKETYEYLYKLEAYLRKKIERLSIADGEGFQYWLQVHGNYLPSPRMRWCTIQLKIKPFERYVGSDLVYSYIGIRADEDRDGYISKKENIIPLYPFKEDGIDRDDVIRILEESSVGMPDYYKWRTRSGCYFCFFQRKSEWIGLLENHPELYEKAKSFEKLGDETGSKFTWTEGESLEDLAHPSRIAEIKANHEKAMSREKRAKPNRPLVEVLAEVLDAENDDTACNICHI